MKYGNEWIADNVWGSNSATYTITTYGTSTAAAPTVTIQPAAPSAPLTEVERLLADVDAICALGR